MLRLLELIGGALLTVLLFEPAAFRDAAALAIGLLLGYVLNERWPNVFSVFTDPSAKTWGYFVGIPLLMIMLILLLSRLRKEFV